MDMTKFEKLEINDADLDGELKVQTANFVWVAKQSTEAEAACEVYKLRVKQLTATLDEKIRAKALKDGAKTTEAGIQKEIERHPDYIKAMEHQIVLSKQMSYMKALAQAWRDRRELLIEICRRDRDEMRSLSGSTVNA